MRDGRWGEVFPSRRTAGGAQEGQVWERHLAFLKEHVPPEKLVFFDVRDGWKPLVSNSQSQFSPPILAISGLGEPSCGHLRSFLVYGILTPTFEMAGANLEF
jgi:hypothetical protein